MNKEDCIKELKAGNTSEEVIKYAISALERGSKSWKGYRRFKRKYVGLVVMLRQFDLEFRNFASFNEDVLKSYNMFSNKFRSFIEGGPASGD